MSIRLPTTDLTGKIAGNTGSVTWTGQHISPALATQMYGAGTAIQVYNESGCGLNITFQGDTSSSFIPAGGWRVFTIGPDIQQYTWTVDYVLPNAPVNHLITVWYAPGEQVDETGFLGNSPIGVSAVPVSVSQVINDGNPLITVVLEATPSGGVTSAKINNDGSGYLSGGFVTYDNNGSLKCGNGLDSAIAANSPLELASNGTLLDIFNNSGDNNWSWVPKSSGGVGRGGVLYSLDGGNTLHSALGFNANGVITNVSTQAAVGNVGVPVVVAQAINVNVAVTTLQTILSYTPTTAGLYSLYGFITQQNAGGGNLTFTYNWVDAHFDGAAVGGNFIQANSGVYRSINAIASTGNNSIGTLAVTLYLPSTSALTISYQDSAGTPNDFVSVVVTRLG